MTGRADVALVAAALTAFAGGLDFTNDRLWVNSMFLVGHVAYPIYPRDLVFGILPFAMLAFLRATDGERRWVGWALVAGGLLGLCALIQVQLLLPIPVALTVLALARAWRDRDRWIAAIGALVITGAVTLLLVGPWLVWLAGVISKNGGFSIDSSADLLPVRIGFWDYPIQFGLILPLAVIGAGVALLFLRQPDGPRPNGAPGRWSPRPAEGGLLLIAWWVVPWVLAVLYQPSWPLEDALRPQRLWLIASQPGLILAAIGLVGWSRPSSRPRVRGSGVRHRSRSVLVLVASVPVTVATTRLLASTWTEPIYAHLRLGPDRVPDFAALLPSHSPRPTVLTYEDWSSLAWYETGVGVVAVVPPGYAKLAFDPAAFTGHSQAERRSDLAAGFRGDPVLLGRNGRSVWRGSHRAGPARCDDGPDQPAGRSGGSHAGAVTGTSQVVEGNGWDAVTLDPGATLTIPAAADGPIDLEIRLLTPATDPATAGARFRLHAGDTSDRPDRHQDRRRRLHSGRRPRSTCRLAPRCASRRSTRSPSSR